MYSVTGGGGGGGVDGGGDDIDVVVVGEGVVDSLEVVVGVAVKVTKMVVCWGCIHP